MKTSVFAAALLLSAGLLQAELIKTNFSTGELQSETNYRDGTRSDMRKGIKEGVEKNYYQSGKIAFQVNYVDDKRDGVLQWYDKQGNLLSQTPYKMGKLVGLDVSYFANQQIKHTVMYVDDQKEGLEKEYFNNNQLALVVPFVHGKKEGLQKEYTYEGKLYTEVTYKNNYKEGLQTWYDANGNVAKTQLFEMDRPVEVMKKQEKDYEQSKIVIEGLNFSPNRAQ